jgi:ferredoxin
MASYKIEQDMNECISCGACVAVCDENWEMDDEGTVKAKKEVISEEELQRNQEAAESCPVECITITKIE